MHPSPLRIEALQGYTPTIGRLVGMLMYARNTTIAAVQGLTVAQLDHLHDDQSNSIGALLAHIIAIEHAYQINVHWAWFHVAEDEINHRGQIRWLRRRLPNRGA
jgi:uncharacterized damage-inducible protein DinB